MKTKNILKPITYSVSILLGAVLLWPAMLLAQDTIVETDSHRFQQVAEGVWFATGTGSVFTMSNAMVLVGENDTLVVDSHVTGAAAQALLDSIPALTDKPIRYLVNSHYHFDHAHGNQSFPEGIEIIGHEYTRIKLNGERGNVLEESTFRSFSDPVPATIANLQRQVAAESDTSRKAGLQERLRVQQEYLAAIQQVVPTPPNITLDRKMTLFQDTANGSREIQLHHFGRAHTGGDVVIYLPQEKLVFTGDMMLPGLAYMGDGHVDEWPETLEGLKTLDFDKWMPGHGPVMESREPIGNFQTYLRDLWEKTSAMHRRGVSADQAAEQIDMTNHSSSFAQIRGPGVDPRAIRRIYQLLNN
ncbi:MAG: MBL fold metallo-hydrolase [Gammaproteobacteria bacterium]|jgi:glyoxylase-like metal-dependent hydrolase (beta-lactamase superfamily II)|nr:MBL fold metallo-hydrolase [Gammaproteobacteria bacterium]MBT3860033.1 MBL fold metallo-hydrolase [Gammaproteobacteria bacterium]MBT3987017.1 MBL fold metallo-hydrolase [Gammaproteobacteria bacterium]MBT4256761.1 MBL fold metallo-hydrolase [Gammaproteobacteria bacterium]MBT4580718.1 MBL fold metallo-hydrolase [Gammaproteobacteria bacterium]